MATQVKYYGKSVRPGSDDVRIEVVSRFYPIDHVKRVLSLLGRCGLAGFMVAAVWTVGRIAVESVSSLGLF
jgi:hypothetical protein